MDNNELYHYGKKGMKWGVRRYQNADGSLTEAGKRRYQRDLDEHDSDWAKKNHPDANRWVKEDLGRTKKLAEASSKLISDAERIANKSHKPSNKLDLSKMTDQQMRTEINRAILEKQYNDMFAPKTVSKGREYTKKILEAAGTTLGVASSALGIALAIKELTSK